MRKVPKQNFEPFILPGPVSDKRRTGKKCPGIFSVISIDIQHIVDLETKQDPFGY